MSISNFKIKQGLDLDGLVLSNINGSLHAGVNELATKNYVDATAQGLDVKASVKYATATSLAGTFTSDEVGSPKTFTATANEILLVDGQQVSLGDRVLVKNESSVVNNGIYEVTVVGDDGTRGGSAAPAVLVRTSDGIPYDSLTTGAFAFVEFGNTNAGKGFVATVPSATDISWTQFSEAGNYITSVSAELDVTNGNLSVVAGTFDAAGAAAAAQTAAEGYADSLAVNYDAAGAAAAAQTAAEGYADSLAVNYDAAGAASSAQSAAEANAATYTDNKVAGIGGSYIDWNGQQLDVDVNGLGQALGQTFDAYGAASSAQSAAEGYADGLINDASSSSTEVWSAYKTSTEIGLKQDTLTAGTGIDITGNTISVTSAPAFISSVDSSFAVDTNGELSLSDAISIASVELTDSVANVTAASDVFGNASTSTYAMGSAVTVGTLPTGADVADVFITLKSGTTSRTSRLTFVNTGVDAPIWTEYGIIDSGSFPATAITFDSNGNILANVTGSGTYSVKGVVTILK